MTIKKKVFIILLLCLSAQHIAAQQGVAVNTTGTTANPSAILDVSSTAKGILIPRMTNAQLTAISTPPAGLMVYQTDIDSGFYYYTGARWVQMAAVDTSTR